jgi:hypothetical protein
LERSLLGLEFATLGAVKGTGTPEGHIEDLRLLPLDGRAQVQDPAQMVGGVRMLAEISVPTVERPPA